MAESDYFSLLPDDCLIEVFSLLDRDSLDMVERVSRKTHLISKNKTVQRVKRIVNEARIMQNNSLDYVLTFKREGNGLMKDRLLLFVFESTELCYSLDEWNRRMDHSNEFVEKGRAPPEELFDVMKKYLENCAVDSVVLDRVLFDSSSAVSFASVCRPIDVKLFEFSEVASNPGTIEQMNQIVHSVMKSSIVSLKFIDSPFVLIVNEQFLTDFSVESNGKRCITVHDCIPKTHLSKNGMEAISRFHNFSLPTIVIPTEHLVHLFKERLTMENPQGEWRIGVTTVRVTHQDFDPLGEDFELVELNRDGARKGRIVCLKNGNSVDFIFSCAAFSFVFMVFHKFAPQNNSVHETTTNND